MHIQWIDIHKIFYEKRKTSGKSLGIKRVPIKINRIMKQLFHLSVNEIFSNTYKCENNVAHWISLIILKIYWFLYFRDRTRIFLRDMLSWSLSFLT